MEAKTEAISRFRMQHTEDVVHCPSCDAALKPYEVAKHCEEEMEQLKRMPVKLNNVNGEEVSHDSPAGANDSRNGESRKPWSVFRRVQKNRQSRLKLRSRKRPQQQEHLCPVCNLSFPQEEIQRHAEQCLRRSNDTNGRQNGDENSEDDSEDGGGEYEEYEWAGQKRVRASSLLQGGYASLGVGTVITNHNTDEDDEDLNVDEDDTQIYGPPQYAENDVIPPAIDMNGPDEDHNVATYVRRLIAGNTTTNPDQSPAASSRETTTASNRDHSPEQPKATTEEFKYTPNSIDSLSADSTMMSTNGQNYLQIIESLKAKLRHYENHIQNKFKCLICLDDYRNPAISVSCWHVHCEECWLRSLGARKLCPQCNLITSPKDLRRIYM